LSGAAGNGGITDVADKTYLRAARRSRRAGGFKTERSSRRLRPRRRGCRPPRRKIRRIRLSQRSTVQRRQAQQIAEKTWRRGHAKKSCRMAMKSTCWEVL
jgi:hypothetical protein